MLGGLPFELAGQDRGNLRERKRHHAGGRSDRGPDGGCVDRCSSNLFA